MPNKLDTKESFIVNSLETRIRLDQLLNEIYKDKVLLLTDGNSHYTVILIKEKSMILSKILLLVSSMLENEFLVTVNDTLCFSSESSEKAYYLLNYDVGTIEI